MTDASFSPFQTHLDQDRALKILRTALDGAEDGELFLERSRGTGLPWQDARVFDTRIRRNVKLAECPSHGKSILRYAPNCPGAIDYASLANEVLGRVSTDDEIEFLKLPGSRF